MKSNNRAKRRATNTEKATTSEYKRKNRIKGESKTPKHNRNYKNEF
tara:strand:- start:571 stop:708 length:138 start_codon:yes stop_codon:yes gene_type:complete